MCIRDRLRLALIWKAAVPILVILVGMLTDVRLEQPLNVAWGISVSVIPSAKRTDARLLQSANAFSPRLVTVAGMVTEVRPLPLKA